MTGMGSVTSGVRYLNYDAETDLMREAKQLYQRRELYIAAATQQGVKKPNRGHAVDAIKHELNGICKGVAAARMAKIAAENNGETHAIWPSDIMGDLDEWWKSEDRKLD